MRARFGQFKGFISEKAGPQARRATWSAWIDALALIFYPSVLFAWLKLAFQTRSY
jgi:hypothetical protein